MNVTEIKDALEPIIVARGLKIVDVEISKFEEVTVTIDALEGSVSMDDCVAVNRRFTQLFDQDELDYALTVTSPGVKISDEEFDKQINVEQ